MNMYIFQEQLSEKQLPPVYSSVFFKCLLEMPSLFCTSQIFSNGLSAQILNSWSNVDDWDSCHSILSCEADGYISVTQQCPQLEAG